MPLLDEVVYYRYLIKFLKRGLITKDQFVLSWKMEKHFRGSLCQQ
jgi:hypothetical protein